ncbi:MAG: site-specific integrase [Oligoflexia bacterium]|nr:site-specific integrase [Oligoflexia bacterium]
MGIRYNERKKRWEVNYHQRHPITGIPITISKTIGIKSKNEALRVYTELKKQLQEKFERLIIPNWAVVVDKYIRSQLDQGFSKKSIENAQYSLKAYTLNLWGEKLITSITGQDIRLLVKDKLSNKSIAQQKNVLKYIRGVFRYAMEAGVIMANPTPQMKFREGDKIKKVLTEEQIVTLLKKAMIHNNEWYPIWTMALYTGMRNGELFALKWDKVDLERRHILIDQSWNSKDGFKSTKSGDDRIAEIALPLIPVLKELKIKSGGQGFVLPRIEKWERGEQARELRKFLDGIGLDRIRFHDLRASWATVMLSKGVEPIKVMSMGGWKNLKTMQIYVRKAGINIKGITDELDFGQVEPGMPDFTAFDPPNFICLTPSISRI